MYVFRAFEYGEMLLRLHMHQRCSTLGLPMGYRWYTQDPVSLSKSLNVQGA